jgi:hypothetical protein
MTTPNQDTVIEDVAINSSFINNNPDDKAAPESDDDPEIAAMLDAQKEIAAQQPAKEADAEKAEAPAEQKEPVKAEEAKPADEKQIMIPKPRLDEALRKSEQLKHELDYTRGALDVALKMHGNQAEKPAAPSTPPAAAEPSIDQLITSIESKRIALAEQYDLGNLSTAEYEKSKIALDRETRAIDAKQNELLVAKAREEANAVSSQLMAQQTINDYAVQLEAAHPYTKEIDALPPAIAKGVWQEIANEAAQNLLQKGVNPNDGTLQSRIAFMAEKAALSDKYGKQYTGKDLGSSQTQTGKQPLSPIAEARKAKMEVANSQPPVTADIGNLNAPTRGALTEAQANSMSDDEMADYLKATGGCVAISG